MFWEVIIVNRVVKNWFIDSLAVLNIYLWKSVLVLMNTETTGIICSLVNHCWQLALDCWCNRAELEQISGGWSLCGL